MKKIISIILIITFLLCGCEGNTIQEEHIAEKNKYQVKQIEFPFGKWEYNENHIFFDYYDDGVYEVYEGQRKDDKSVYSYVIHSYDCLTKEWEKKEFKWNSALQREKLLLWRELQRDSSGRTYVLAISQASDNPERGSIYELKEDGTIQSVDEHNKLIDSDETVNAFKLLSNGKFLISIQREEGEKYQIYDFVNQTIEETSIPTDTNFDIGLNRLVCINDDIYCYPYSMSETECAVQFKKFDSNMPEKVIVFDYEREQRESLYSWHMCKDGEDNPYLLTRQGIYVFKENEAEKEVEGKYLSEIFSNYDSIDVVAKYGEGQYFTIVQNTDNIVAFEINSYQ